MIFRKARPFAAAVRAAFTRLTRPRTQHKDEVEAAPSEREGGGEAEHTEGQSLTAPPYEGEVQTQYAAGDEAQRQDERNRAEGDPHLRTQVRQNWIMVGATIIIAFATVITTVTGIYQWKAIREQLASADETSKQNERLISAMQKQADAAATQANTSQSMAEHNWELVGHAGEQAKAMTTQAGASQAQAGAAQASARAAETSAEFAGKTVEATRAATFTANRAYFTIRQILPPELADDKVSRVSIIWDNDGNSPARMIEGYIGAGFKTQVPTWNDCVTGKGRSIQAATVQPHSQRTQRFNFAAGVFNQSQIDKMERGQLWFVICGNLTYETLNVTFPFKFCSYWDRDLKDYVECKGAQGRK